MDGKFAPQVYATLIVKRFSSNYDIPAAGTHGMTAVAVDLGDSVVQGYIPIAILQFHTGGQIFPVGGVYINTANNHWTVNIENAYDQAYTGRTAFIDVLYAKEGTVMQEQEEEQ